MCGCRRPGRCACSLWGRWDTPEDPLALNGDASTPCTQVIVDGHNHEGAGEPVPVAFLPSIRECGSLAEWTAAAKAFGIDLRNREAQFVDNTCNAATTSAADPRRVP